MSLIKDLIDLFRSETRKIRAVFSHPTFIYLTVAGNALLFITTFGVYLLERGDPKSQIRTYFDALWWGASTITTIGYGDVLPQSLGGRVIGIGLMFTGTVLFISFTGVLLSILMKEEVEEELAPLKAEMNHEEKSQMRIEKNLRELNERINRLEKGRSRSDMPR